jgi:hypothetical protein
MEEKNLYMSPNEWQLNMQAVAMSYNQLKLAETNWTTR